MSEEKNGIKIQVSFNMDKLKLAILEQLKEPKHSSQLIEALTEDLIPNYRTGVFVALMELERDGLVTGDYRIIEQPTATSKGKAGKFYSIAQTKEEN